MCQRPSLIEMRCLCKSSVWQSVSLYLTLSLWQGRVHTPPYLTHSSSRTLALSHIIVLFHSLLMSYSPPPSLSLSLSLPPSLSLSPSLPPSLPPSLSLSLSPSPSLSHSPSGWDNDSRINVLCEQMKHLNPREPLTNIIASPPTSVVS